MIKLNVGICRKQGLPDYGSAGASVNLEIELPCDALADLEALQSKIRSVQAICARAVADQLAAEPAPASTPAPAPDRPANAPANGRPPAAQRTHVNVKPFEGTPRSGSALLAYLQTVKDEAPWLFKYVVEWGKLQGYPGKVKDWGREEAGAAFAEAQARMARSQSQEVGV